MDILKYGADVEVWRRIPHKGGGSATAAGREACGNRRVAEITATTLPSAMRLVTWNLGHRRNASLRTGWSPC
jgi:hypothetical protein